MAGPYQHSPNLSARHSLCRFGRNSIGLSEPENMTNRRFGARPLSHLVYIINGPNLNLLGTREPEVYGPTTLDDISQITASAAENVGLTVGFRQSNDEGTLVDWIQEAGKKASGLIINGAGYTHTSVAIMDALLAIDTPVIEVHLSNIYTREEFRHHSYISRAAQGVICGFGAHGYVLAVNAMAQILEKS